MTEATISTELRARIDDFLLDYAHCIDDDDLEQWPSFFAESGLYQIIPREGYEAGHPIGVMLCRGRGMMIDRVRAMRQANIYEPQRYTHILSRSQMASRGSAITLRTNFQILRTMQDGACDLFACGHYLDAVQVEDTALTFLERRVLLDSRRIDTLLVVPI